MIALSLSTNQGNVMKKTILVAVLGAMASATTFAGSTVTDLSNPKPYIGLDYTYLSDVQGALKSTYDSQVVEALVDNYTNQVSLVAGVQLNDYIGLETTLGKNIKDISKIDGIKLSLQTATLAVTGQYPMYDRFYAKGAVGQAWNRFEVKFDGEKEHDSIDKFFAKAGVGYQWTANSVTEATYVYNGGMDGFSLQYKYVF